MTSARPPESAVSEISKLGAGRPRHAKVPSLRDGASLTWQGGLAPRCIPLKRGHNVQNAIPGVSGLPALFSHRELTADFRILARQMPKRAMAVTAPISSPLGKLSRSGSEKRQRQHRLTLRFSDEEWAMLEERAGRRQQSWTAYLRERGLGDPGPRAKRRPTVDAVALARAVGALNKAGSNLNQIARALNSQESVALPGIEAARAELLEVLVGIRRALGHDRQG